MREISGNMPALSTHWYSTGKPLISAMEMHLGKRYTADIIVDKCAIYFTGGYNRSPFLSATEIGRFIIFQLKKTLLEEAFKVTLLGIGDCLYYRMRMRILRIK
jgi:hypothetical protein